MAEDANVNTNQSQANTDGGGDNGGQEQGQQGGGDGGSQQPTFLDTLPEEIRGFEGFKDVADVGALASRFVDLAKSQPVVPDKPEAYEIPVPDGLPKNENFLNEFRGIAHQAKLTQEQVNAVSAWWNSNLQKGIELQGKIQEESEKVLRAEWKGDYDHNMEIAKRALNQFGGDELTEFLEKTRLGDNPVIVKTFVEIGKAISEDVFRSGKNKPQEVKRTPGGTPILNFPSMNK